MPVFWSKSGSYHRVEYDSEADLEKAIIEIQNQLFGPSRYYLDVKKKIGAKGSFQNIPDGYLLDLSRLKPRLYVVENELQSHDPLRHIAVQILQFSLSFEAEPLTVKKALLHALQNQPPAKQAAEEYAAKRAFRNLDHLLEYLVAESPFSALVIIDSMPEELEGVLADKFRFGVEVIELSRYENEKGERAYNFEPFLAEVIGEASSQAQPANETQLSTEEIDTVVVPARVEGFQKVFLGENCWYKVRIHGSVRPQIKYIAGYQVAPISAITHIAPVKSIEPWKDSGKFVLRFSEPAKAIGPIPLVKNGLVKAPQGLRYTTLERLFKAKNMDELFGPDGQSKAAGAGE
ncbi:MAG TPA: hypothetical protein VFP59_03810 [Candidatus Angelobacter sp.]|nr:hypothetical protein [Candidatus Angelobacter sp.]